MSRVRGAVIEVPVVTALLRTFIAVMLASGGLELVDGITVGVEPMESKFAVLTKPSPLSPTTNWSVTGAVPTAPSGFVLGRGLGCFCTGGGRDVAANGGSELLRSECSIHCTS